jgi:hypothetical protein
MSEQPNLVKDILSIYNTILENKEMVEVSDIYDNVDFKDNVVGNSKPSQDNINTSLLQDVQTAAKNAGVVVDVTTAISGHGTDKPTRHVSGNAVDIAMINNKAVSGSNRADADKFVDALVRMGYSKNVESGNPKSVLTFGFPGHDNHVHVSNNSGQSSETTNSNASDTAYNNATKTAGTPKSSNPFNASGVEKDDFLTGIAKGLTSKMESIQEQRNFGKDVSNRYGRIIIPKDSNPKIKSPISGVIYNKRYSSNCINQVTILNTDNQKIYIQFCGISSPKVRDGQSISVGDLLGTTDSDVEVTMYDSSWSRIPIGLEGVDKYTEKKKDDKEKVRKKDDTNKYYTDPLTAIAAGVPGKILNKIFGDKYDEKTGERTQKRWGGVADEKPVDPWLLDLIKSPFKSKKVNEYIERIKKLL